MDAKDLRIGSALGERNDGSKYSQSGVALPTKSYQDNGCNPLGKAEVAAVRPCAVIGPDRVVPPPASDAYLKKASVDQWSCPDNLYTRLPEYPHKQLNNVNPSRNISPRQTFQENMQRIMVPPTYNAAKHADESILGQVQDRNAALSKNTKQTMALEAKYCDVPYAVNLLNEHKNVRETEMCVPSVNSPLTRSAPSVWPSGGSNLHPRGYAAHDVYQYPQYPSCAGPRPSVMPMARPHRAFQEDSSYVYPDPYYQDAGVRYKPYQSVKERYPQARYEYINNYPNPFHPPPPYASHKYDIPNTRPTHPYSVYPHLKYLDNRILDPNIDVCQRPNQQSIHYNMQFRNQVLHPTYGSALGNPQNKLPSYSLDKSSNKLSLDNTKSYVDYENAKAKYALPDSYFVNEMPRVHQVQKPVAMPNYAPPGMHPSPLQQFHRKDNIPMKSFEYMPHYRHFEHALGFNPSGHHPPQFSPSALAISPSDSNTSNDTTQTQGNSQEDCGYVSQSSTTSARSIDSNRLQNEYYRRYDYRYRPIIGNSHTLAKPDMTPNKESKKIDVRQFLSMWSEGDEDNTNSNAKENSATNSYRRQESVRNQDQLYVLGLVNVPSEELAKYEHIQKVSKLPENIKGYNNIELLNQFEEVIESSNMNSFKPSIPKDFFAMKDRKNAIKQIVEVLPRPVSPLDVEAKISQSVIHKEVGCNFEIKPCSPKMLNVEIAAPVQNILGERSIEKVSNPLSNKAKSPLPTRIDGNTTCNNIQRQEGMHTSYENISCKMTGSPFAANNMESVKTDYSLHDLENSSGVCLASLPRLDNEIELNFPEVNQQFINANKGSRNLQDNYNREVKDDNIKLTTANDKNKTNNDSEKYLNVSIEDSGTKLSKLSKYRKTKVNTGCLEYPEDESKANAIRTDSVIIENPENVRKHEDNKEKISLHMPAVNEKENTPMNLTTQSVSHIESEFNTTNSQKPDKQTMDCALDFSFSKTENELSSLNVFDEELGNTSHKEMLMETITSHCNSGDHENKNIIEISNKPSKLLSEYTSNKNNNNNIIVKNNRNPTCDYTQTLEEETSVLEAPKFDADSSENDDKMNGDINFDKNKLNTGEKTNLTNVIVKHKHKNKSKISKSKHDIKKSNLQNELRNKSLQNLKKNYLHSSSASKNHDESTNVGEKVKSKSVIQNNNDSEENNSIMEEAARDMCKNETGKITFTCENDCASRNPTINISESHHCGDKINTVEDQSYLSSVNEDPIKNNTKTLLAKIHDCKNVSKNLIENMVESANEVPIKTDAKISRPIKIKDSAKNSESLIEDIVQEINDSTRLICDAEDFPGSYAGISQANKYYNDLISESELFVDKTYCIGAVNQSPSSSISHLETTSADSMNILVNSTVEHASNINTKDTTDGMILDKSLVSESDLLQHKQCHTDNSDELNMNSLEDFENSVGVGQLQCMEKDVTQSFNSKDACENTSTTVTSLSDGIEVDKINVNTTVKNNAQQPSASTETMFIADKKLSIDSGYLSKKNSFEENNEEIIGFPSNSSEDSVFDEIESGTKSMALDGFVEINNEKNDTLQPVFDSSTSASTCEANYLILGNKTSEDSNNELEKQLTTLKSNSIIEDLDTNMQIDKSDVLHPISDKLISTGAGNTLLPEVKTFEDANTKMNILPSTVLQSDVVFDNVDANMQILFAQPNEEVPFLNVDKIDDLKVVDKNVQLQTYNNLATEFDMPDSKSELDKANSENQTQLNKKKLNANEITKVDNIDEEKNMKKQNSFDMLDKDKINDLSDSVEITDIVEPCIKSFNKDCRYTKIDILCTHSKKMYGYCGKELHSPWIQKLIMYNEGKSNISDINGTKEIKQLNDNNEIISLEEPNNSVMKEATFDCAIYEINSENEIEKRDVNQKLNVKCENRSSETSSMIIPNCSNDESSFISNQEKTVEINEDKSSISERKCESGFDDDCIEESSAQNDLVDTNEISFSYPNNSIISQITENEFHTNENLLKLKFQDQNNTGSQINQRRLLKRSFSDSALNTNINRNGYHTEGFENLNNDPWPLKRNKIGEYVNYIPNNRRNSVNFEENVSFCILIDDNCIITEENEECIAELQENFITETENDGDDSESLNELDTSVHETNFHISNAVVLEYDEENPARDAWVEDINCVEDVFRDEVAENVVISAPSSPTDSTEEYEHDVSSIYENTTSCHTDEVRFLCTSRENIMSQDDSQMVDTLYKTHQMDKTLLYGDKNIESDSDPENILSESDSWKPSPAHSPDYIDPTNASNDFRLETPENKENVFVKELSPLRRIDDYLDVSSAENETDEQIDKLPHDIAESDKLTQEGSVYSCESSSYNLFDYKLKDQSADTTMPTSSSSPEVSSTTSEEKSSSILLKITNLNGSRVSQVNEIQLNNRPRCKFTEKKDYSTSSLNFPNRPLITKAAQKYIPPIKESIRDLKVKISLPRQSLNKLKQLKLSRNEPKIHKQQSAISRITKKPKPNFDDVLKSIDEIQIKRHKEKSKKNKTVVPKVLIKKNENGSHYASTPKRDTFSPDLTGRKWQPWVYLEKNHFIDKMAVRNKTKAIFSHRKKTYVLAEKFKKYKSVSSAKFIITQPKTPGQLKYTIRLKHSF